MWHFFLTTELKIIHSSLCLVSFLILFLLEFSFFRLWDSVLLCINMTLSAMVSHV